MKRIIAAVAAGAFMLAPTAAAAQDSQPWSIAGEVLIDADGNGIKDDARTPLEHVRVEFVSREGESTGMGFTAADGRFSFQVPNPEEEYDVCFDMETVTGQDPLRLAPAPKDQGSDDTLDSDVRRLNDLEACTDNLDLWGGGTGQTFLIDGLYVLSQGSTDATVSGTTFDDRTHGARQNGYEAPLSGVTVEAYAADTLVATTVSAADGGYSLTLRANTAHRLHFSPPAEYQPTIPDYCGIGCNDEIDSDVQADGNVAVTSGPIGSVTDVDAGYVRIGSVVVGDYAWIDLTRDGIEEPGTEPALCDVDVVAWDGEGNEVERTKTDKIGVYFLTSLKPETEYTLTFDASHAGYRFTRQTPDCQDAPELAPTLPLQGDDPERDSHIDENGQVVITTPAGGESMNTIDAGYVEVLADLVVDVQASAALLLPQGVDFDIAVTNNGPAQATGVKLDVQLTLPPGMSLSDVDGCTANATTLSCDLGSLNAGQTVLRTISVESTLIVSTGDVVAAATATGKSLDLHDANNTDSGSCFLLLGAVGFCE